MSSTTSPHGVPVPLGRVARDARHVPATAAYAATLLVATIALRSIDPAWRHRLLADSSTNVANLARAPVRVLVTSAFWLQGRPVIVWIGLLVVLMALTERWLGTLRTIGIVVVGHVGATLLTQGAVAIAVAATWMPRSSLHMPDVGISYGLAALAGALTLRVVGLRRVLHATVSLGVILLFLVLDPGVGNIGHVVAFGLGLGAGRLLRTRTFSSEPHERASDPKTSLRNVRAASSS